MNPRIPSFLSALAAMWLTAACGSAPAKAPGSNPEDMTPEGHHEAAEQEREKAAEHERQAEDVQPTKSAVEDRERAQHEREAEKHGDFADQHEKAGEAAAADAGAKPEKKKSK
jgi:hypothetical protein